MCIRDSPCTVHDAVAHFKIQTKLGYAPTVGSGCICPILMSQSVSHTCSTNWRWCDTRMSPPSHCRSAVTRAPSESRSRKLVGSSSTMTCGAPHTAAASTTQLLQSPGPGCNSRRSSCEILNLVTLVPVSYTHLRAHETPEHLVCRLLLEKKKQ
eukprot:TRINITY_DN15850_c0_g1_i1.p1 TRINITY_DN15850_c0_g1~~TRINITY_DN15850_c0_g1_i1.p1  ORF type:complete len:154 (+),score=13.44 TRINITY_DN15850_c0_g1_i1:150-611(+)